MNIIDHRTAAYPSPLGPVVLLTVLTQDAIGDFAAYAAILPDAGTGVFDTEWASHNGAKLTWAEAAKLFGKVTADNYRR